MWKHSFEIDYLIRKHKCAWLALKDDGNQWKENVALLIKYQLWKCLCTYRLRTGKQTRKENIEEKLRLLRQYLALHFLWKDIPINAICCQTHKKQTWESPTRNERQTNRTKDVWILRKRPP